jgi:predicted alpha/beta-fold hydrolase
MNTCKPFKPSITFKNAHFQTLYASLFRKQSTPQIEKEIFELNDGDFVECFWHLRPQPSTTSPIVILFHGLEGSFESPYIKGVINALAKEGITSVLMHFRGCSGKKNRLARAYHSGDTHDAYSWILHVKKQFNNAPLFAVGYSLGGNMLLKLLGEYGRDLPLKGAIAVSAPMKLDVCANQMNRGFSQFYQWHLLRSLKPALINKYRDHDMKAFIGVDENHIKKLKDFWHYDDVYTAPIHGFTSAVQYYEQSSSLQFLKKIKHPTLIIHAKDDPFMTPEVLPKYNDISKSITLDISQHGGHVGFIEGSFFRPKYWLEERIVCYIKELYPSK